MKAVFHSVGSVFAQEQDHGSRRARINEAGRDALLPIETAASPPDHETERIRRLFNALAPTYDREISLWEKAFYGGCRRWVCSQAVGEVLEIAIGTGRNLPFYPPAVRLTGIELSEAMLALARRRARILKRRVDLRRGDAQALELPDRSFDTVVLSIALCAIPDPRKALAEARRVLKPGGRLLLFEHVRSPSRWVHPWQRLLGAFSLRLGGRYLLRDPRDWLAEAGFEIEHLEHRKLGVVQRLRARCRGSAGVEAGGGILASEWIFASGNAAHVSGGGGDSAGAGNVADTNFSSILGGTGQNTNAVSQTIPALP